MKFLLGKATLLLFSSLLQWATANNSTPEFASKLRPYNPESRELLNDDDAYFGYGFDITNYSLKYARCQMVESFNEQAAANGGSPLTNQNLVIFRLCPTNTCNANEHYGCDEDYGQYAIPLEDYLEYYSKFLQAKNKHYCNYCEQCLNEDANAAANNGDDAYNNNSNQATSCKYDCSSYSNDCQGNNNNNNNNNNYVDDAYAYQEPVEYENYFGCQGVNYNIVAGDDAYGNNNYNNNNNNNNKLYIGAYCSSDATTIKIDVFYDQYCTQYAGDKYNVNTVSGINFQSSGLYDYYHPECVSCKESQLPYNDANDDNYDDDNVSEICEELYDISAKCNRNFLSYDKDSYGSVNQYRQEKTACNYIYNIMAGSYDETGKVYLDQKSYNKQKGYFEQIGSGVQPWQVASLALLAFGIVILSITTYYLEPQVKVPLVAPPSKFNQYWA